MGIIRGDHGPRARVNDRRGEKAPRGSHVPRRVVLKWAMLRRSLEIGAALLVCSLASATATAAAGAKTFTLPELIEAARRANPVIMADAAAVDAMQAQVLEAERNWWPSGDLTSFVTAVPKIGCVNDAEGHCVATTSDPSHHSPLDAITKLAGPFSRTELKVIQPLYDFGKISAGVEAAENGVVALRHKQAGTAAEVELNVRKAYWGRKLARELLDALEEGTSYIDDALGHLRALWSAHLAWS